MLFNSAAFLAFFGLVLIVQGSRLPWSYRKFFLLLSSYFFYAAWNPPFVFLLWFSTLVDYFVGLAIFRTPENQRRRRKALLVLSLIANLGLLGYFKYGLFAIENGKALASLLGWNFEPTLVSIVLPVGISFYTFQTISYTLDIYNGRIQKARSFLDYALYVTFFPQLVAGPIVRSEEFLPQCREESRVSGETMGLGLFVLTLGLFQKVVLADLFLAPVSDAVFGGRYSANVLNHTTGMLAFAGQILFDFSGYTNCAIGAALCLGFRLPVNFNSPYAAVGLRDFWRRWHITLSSWLRDYLYIPLGGSRQGAIRMVAALFITMLLGGLWHGASWNFVIWGALHGFFLIAERWLRQNKEPVQSVRAKKWTAFFTFLIVSFAWIFFRSSDLPAAMRFLGGLIELNLEGTNLKGYEVLGIFLFTWFMLRWQWKWRDKDLQSALAEWGPARRILIWLFIILFLILIRGGEGNAFIYFQF